MPNSKYYYLTESQRFFLRAGDSPSINLRLKGLKNRYNTIIAGRVLEGELPIEAAAVIIMDEDFNELYKASTDVNGIFLFKEIVPVGQYKIIGSAPGFKTSEAQDLTVTEGSASKVFFRLTKDTYSSKAIIYGTVQDITTGAPMQDARIYLTYRNRKIKSSDSVSNSKGEYIIYNITPGEYIIHAEAQGYDSSLPISIKIEDNSMIPVDMVLSNIASSLGTISGSIKDSVLSSKGVPVFLYKVEKGREILREVQSTNSSGSYVFSNLLPGTYRVKTAHLKDGEYEETYIIH